MSIRGERQRFKGLDLVIGRREGPYIWNLEDIRNLIDCGTGEGVHSLGHRHAEGACGIAPGTRWRVRYRAIILATVRLVLPF